MRQHKFRTYFRQQEAIMIVLILAATSYLLNCVSRVQASLQSTVFSVLFLVRGEVYFWIAYTDANLQSYLRGGEEKLS